MSGDVQPRKRKDKKKKKDESDEGFAPTKASSSSPSSSHFSEGDSIIHVHHEGGTGGHWCAKIVFFLLLGALVFVIGLILIENRGLTDLDTPVAESRYAQVFDGWVDEGPVHDDHHDEHTLELKDAEDSHEDEHDDDHDDEIEDIEDEHPDSDNEIDHSDEDDATDSDQENDVEENEEQDVEDSGENHNLSNEDPNDSDEEDDDDDDDIAEADDDDDDDIANNEDDDDEYLNGSPEDQNDDVDSVEDASKLEDSSENDVQLPFEEVDSTEEEVVENNVGEEEHIAAKQAEQLAQEQEESGKGKPSGGNAVEDSEPEEWLGDSNDDWKQQLDLAQAEMDEGRVDEGYHLFTALSLTNKSCPYAKLGRAKAMDILAEKKRSNSLLHATIKEYLSLLDMNISDRVFISTAERTINRIRFQGQHLNAVPVHEKLISKFPSQPEYRNQLAITYLMVNKVDLAKKVLQNTLSLWPNDGVALVHYGFILKTVENNLSEAVEYMQKGIDSKDNGTLEGRFLFHLGDALARLGQNDQANKIYEQGAASGVFLSPQQRSLYNVDRLTGRPWWKPEQTPYTRLIKDLEKNWKQISEEAKNVHSNYKPEQENLKDTGTWSQYELFVRGIEVKSHCSKCPVTCNIVRQERAAAGCRRGQVKFSAMNPGTHVFAHTGPTNCRLRAHLGLTGTDGTFIRVAHHTRSWEEGKVFIFDDSFEHEVWHNGTELRIVLIVDLWHPELTKEEHASLPSI